MRTFTTIRPIPNADAYLATDTEHGEFHVVNLEGDYVMTIPTEIMQFSKKGQDEVISQLAIQHQLEWDRAYARGIETGGEQKVKAFHEMLGIDRLVTSIGGFADV